MHTPDALALSFRGNWHFGHIASDYRLRLSYSPRGPLAAAIVRGSDGAIVGRSLAGGPTVWRRHHEAKHPASRGTKSQMDAHPLATSDVPSHSPIKEPSPSASPVAVPEMANSIFFGVVPCPRSSDW